MEEERCIQHVYMQCMKNQSANLVTYTIDGCGEFVPEDAGLYCAACGCHRSFHCKLPAAKHASSQLPPPSLMPTTGTDSQPQDKPRRARTKFTAEQKERMGSFAERIGWRIPKREREDDEEVDRFLEETGVSRRAFKVWMHNHRNAAAQAQVPAESSGTETDDSAPNITTGINDIILEIETNGNESIF